MGTEHIKKEESARYLGLILDQHLRWDVHLAKLEAETNKKIFALFRLFRRHKQIKLCAKRRMYMTLVRPKFDFGCQFWGKAKQSLIETHVNKLEHLFLKKSLGAIHTTNSLALYPCFGLLPHSIRRKQMRRKLVSRIFQNTDKNPLFKHVIDISSESESHEKLMSSQFFLERLQTTYNCKKLNLRDKEEWLDTCTQKYPVLEGLDITSLNPFFKSLSRTESRVIAFVLSGHDGLGQWTERIWRHNRDACVPCRFCGDNGVDSLRHFLSECDKFKDYFAQEMKLCSETWHGGTFKFDWNFRNLIQCEKDFNPLILSKLWSIVITKFQSMNLIIHKLKSN